MPLFVTVTPGTTVTASTTLDASTLNLLGTPSVDVTGTVDGGSITLGSQSVPLPSLYAQADKTIVGNGLGSSASPVALDASTDFAFTPTTFLIKAAAVTTAKIANSNVTYAKIQDVVNDNRLLGRAGGGVNVAEITVGSNLTLSAGALNALRPGVVFTNVEAISNYILPIVRGSAIEITALTTSITPQTATSKVLIGFSFSCEILNTTSGNPQVKQAFILERVVGATVTPLGVPSSPGVDRIYGTKVMQPDAGGTAQLNIVISFVDSPATTAAVTYRIKAYTGGNVTQTMFLNGTINQTDASYSTRATSQVILQEILP